MNSLRVRQVVLSILTVLVVLGIAGYASGVFTGEVHRADTCPICRTDRFSGRQYGFPYNRIEENAFTRWYRANIDPKHGLDPSHPHRYVQSACVAVVSAWHKDFDYQCVDYPPLFMLQPDIELAAVQQIRDKAAQVEFIASLSVPDTEVAKRRVNLLMQWYHLERGVPWDTWWARHATDFGLRAPAGQPVATKHRP